MSKAQKKKTIMLQFVFIYYLLSSGLSQINDICLCAYYNSYKFALYSCKVRVIYF
jgi:hypothetical protein